MQAVTIPFTIGGLVGGASYFGSLEMDPTKLILGVEPFIFYTGCTVACMGELPPPLLILLSLQC